MEGLDRQGLDARVLAGTRVAAIGPGTAAVLRDWGIAADLVPERSIAESLAAELIAQGVADQRVLIPRAAEARDVLPRELEQAGADVQVVPLYETVRERLDEQQLERLAGADYVTFTSSSTVRFLIEAIGGVEHFPERARVVSIGPVTSQTARELGLEVHVEAERHDVDGLVDALLRDAPDGRAGGLGPTLLPISFLSDYGHRDEWVGVCHGVIDRIAPGATVIDIAHDLPATNVRTPHSCWRTRCPSFPPESCWRLSTPVSAPSGVRSRCGLAAGRCWSARTTACCGRRPRRREASRRRST